MSSTNYNISPIFQSKAEPDHYETRKVKYFGSTSSIHGSQYSLIELFDPKTKNKFCKNNTFDL